MMFNKITIRWFWVDVTTKPLPIAKSFYIVYYVNPYDGLVQTNISERLKTLHPPFVYEQNELKFVCPYFVQGPMLFFPSPFPTFSVTGRGALSDQTGSCSLVPKNELHASWRHVGVLLQRGLSYKKAESYYCSSSRFTYTRHSDMIWKYDRPLLYIIVWSGVYMITMFNW